MTLAELDTLNAQAWRLMWTLTGLHLKAIRAGDQERARRLEFAGHRASARWTRRSRLLLK